MEIWNTPAWPHVRQGSAATEARLAQVAARLGAMQGMQAERRSAEERFLLRRNTFFTRNGDLPPRADQVLRRRFAEGESRLAQGIGAGPWRKIGRLSRAKATRDFAEPERRGVLRRGEWGRPVDPVLP